ncbi:IclR family transcriptional regulator [Haloarculaceae archaeon H-GB2-1]|nr:IclR family transcriptional regulator [Haloarculaceae archaeon H-GB1-1]MEA5388027.1 IclR family transcriptional regulator [Haloarculaceae archaeon H-GB11]MEA5409515.1 IclR family transcriptional regulator [Haloarculaceae archaeon H-GB2-1]
MTGTNGDQRTIQSAVNTFDIVEVVAERNRPTLTDICEDVDLSPGTVYSYLVTLRSKGYLTVDDGEYELGLRFVRLGKQSRESELTAIARPILDRIAKETSELVLLHVEQHGRSVIVEKAVGEAGVETTGDVGEFLPMHSNAGGKSMLAHLDDERVREILDRHGLPRMTDTTITQEADLFAELEGIREQGYAFNDAEDVENLFAVGVPIVADDDVLGAITVATPKHRMGREELVDEVASVIRGAANEIELRLTYDS